MTSPSSSTFSVLRCYPCSHPIIVTCERGGDTHSSLGYSHALREIIAACLLVVSNREITKITVHTDRGRAFYPGSVTGDAEAQSVLGQSERTNLDSRLRYDLYRMVGQGYAETFPSRNRNTQISTLDLELVA